MTPTSSSNGYRNSGIRPFDLVLLLLCFFYSSIAYAQVDTTNSVFGKGLRVVARDSSFYMQFRFRIQPNFTGLYEDPQVVSGSTVQEQWSIRRCRLKFDGWAFSPKLVYKFEYDLAGNYIRDATIKWNFAGAFKLWIGQAKLPGNIQRVTSSQTMELVDRSLMNNQFNIDRDVGLQLHHGFDVGKAKFKWAVAYSSGDGIRGRSSSTGGEYTARAEFLPMGAFTNKGEGYEADLAREESPKILLGLSYDKNLSASQDRGSWGSVLTEERDLQAFFVDLTLKYRGVYFLAEYAQKEATNGSSAITDTLGNITGSFRTGYGYNLQGGYLFKSNWELAGRYSTYEPDKMNGRVPLTESTIGLSKYIVGHNLKVQLDLSLLTAEHAADTYRGRLQMELAF